MVGSGELGGGSRELMGGSRELVGGSGELVGGGGKGQNSGGLCHRGQARPSKSWLCGGRSVDSCEPYW